MKLFDYQNEDAKHLSSREGVTGLFSGMGTGKTRTALEAARVVRGWPIVIVAPPIAHSMWEEEAGDHLHTLVKRVKTSRTKIFPYSDDVLILSYEVATRRVEELKALNPRVLICDESHALKSLKAKRTKALLGPGGCTSMQNIPGYLREPLS